MSDEKVVPTTCKHGYGFAYVQCIRMIRADHCTHPTQQWCDCDWCRCIRDHEVYTHPAVKEPTR